ncbi:MAG TPA: hypothetical protein VGR15_00755 [Bacteroidota bacterium]|jgi:hypothetical protein|nr:hypothetical protein [Bacteroidota bacterium]
MRLNLAKMETLARVSAFSYLILSAIHGVATMVMPSNHIQKSLFLSIAILVFVFTCCDEPMSPSIYDNRPILTIQQFNRIRIDPVNYNAVRITHELGDSLRSAEVREIGIGTHDSTGYHQLSSVSFPFDAVLKVYSIDFDFAVTLDSSLVQPLLALRYFLTDSSHIDVDTAVSLFKYPYPSTEVFVTESILLNPGLFQDIDRQGSKFYFHPLGSEGLYAFDLATLQTSYVLAYSGGDHIAADSIFVFCDLNHDRISRYNVLTNAIDLEFPRFESDGIAGLDTYNNDVYVLLLSSKLKKFTMDGILVDSISYSSLNQSYFMTIHDSIVYTVPHGNSSDSLLVDHIGRFDLRTMQFLSELRAPARNIDGIKVSEGQLYYCDHFKHMVGVMPLSDLRP